MRNSNSDRDSGNNLTAAKRRLPSWMNAAGSRNKSQKMQVDANEILVNNNKEGYTTSSSNVTKNSLEFSKFLDGVVFALSGFVNPERSTLRSQALEMGADYRSDWTSDCTLLICAFPYTPKFRQVETDCGTIVSKEWISECYNQKKLVDIEQYLMHAGKPWRNFSKQDQLSEDQETLMEQSQKQETASTGVLIGSMAQNDAITKDEKSTYAKDFFLPSKIKEWVADDLRETMSWLESQDKKPKADDMKGIAAEGIITCLQDAIDSLKQSNNMETMIEEWMFVPRVVKRLTELECANGNQNRNQNRYSTLSKGELYKAANLCKSVYESELHLLARNGKRVAGSGGDDDDLETDPGFDSDETIEMTEEEIDLACKQLGC